MKYIPRYYQTEAAEAALEAFKRHTNGIIVLPTGSGKSLCIALIAEKLGRPLLVFQPSKELVMQNFEKLASTGYTDCSVYSASLRTKEIARVTFATIGSVNNHAEDFAHFSCVVVDECHLVNSRGGMYHDFLTSGQRTVIGLTATPYRLTQTSDGSVLKFLTRTRPAIFKKVLYTCQVGELVDKGYLAKPKYYDITSIDMTRVRSNSTGSDYDEDSLKCEYQRTDFYSNLVATVRRLLHPKSGVPRKGILVFTRFIEEAEKLANEIPGCAMVCANTPDKERDAIIEGFKSGRIAVLTNVSIFATGVDYPALDTIVLARPTKSLGLYYQMLGREIRPFPGKEPWAIDLCGNFYRFGRVEDLKMTDTGNGKWIVQSHGIQLTGVPL